MKITVATKWSELNEWQLQEIAYLYLNASDYNFENQFLQMIIVLFQKQNTAIAQLKASRLFREVPITVLSEYAKFLHETPDLQNFPKIKRVTAPGPRLNNVTIKQFSVADAIFYNWRQTQKEIHLRQLVASLYTFFGDFNALDLPKVAKITDEIPIKKMYQIGLTYLSVRFAIIEKYPKIFPRKKDTEKEQTIPQFRKNDYTPFSKIITTMAMDERQPLGTLKECNNTLLYDFLNTLEESMLRIEREQKAIKNAR